MDYIWHTCARLTLSLLLIPILVGTALAIDPAICAWARHLVPLPINPDTPSLAEFLGLLIHNASSALGPLVAAVALPALRRRFGRLAGVSVLLDVFFSLSWVINGVVLAIATASYGPVHLVAWLPHLPLELGGLSLSLSVYLAARRRAVTPAELLQSATLVALLLAAAAAVETCSQPHV